jgi:undecaprenyl-diphosphatase
VSFSHSVIRGLVRRAWWREPSVYVLAASIAVLFAFTHFASEVSERETIPFDASVRRWVITHRPPALLATFSAITHLGSWIALSIAAAVVTALLLRRGSRWQPLLVAAVPFAFSLVIYGLKGLYRVQRPPAGLTSALTFSFPSGHTSGSTAVFGVIGYVLAREAVVRPAIGWTIATALPIAVGLSRLFLDVHWASDVIGGWMIGAAYAAFVCVLYEHTRRLSRSPRS